jgi:hypothetical protein
MDPDSWAWHWPPFFIYCIACFFAAVVAGVAGVPGIFVVAVGLVLGLVAAARRWFEVPVVQTWAAADCKPAQHP